MRLGFTDLAEFQGKRGTNHSYPCRERRLASQIISALTSGLLQRGPPGMRAWMLAEASPEIRSSHMLQTAGDSASSSIFIGCHEEEQQQTLGLILFMFPVMLCVNVFVGQTEQK